MKKLAYLFCTLAISVNAATMNDCRVIYKRLIQQNNIINYLPLYYDHTDKQDAYSDGTKILVTQGMMKNLNKQEAAFVLAHEISHVKSKTNHSDYLNEYNADMDGAVLDKKAGYNPCEGKKFFLKYLDASTADHPRSIDRYNKIKCYK